jgi:hypothetical protein
MKKALIATMASMIVALPGCSSGDGITPESKMSAYLMVYFKDNTHGLYMALSPDGYTFTDVNGGNPIMAGDTLAMQKGVRDPYIVRGPGDMFYIAATDLHVRGMRAGYRDTQWERPVELYQWGNNRALVLMSSKDLINWKHTDYRVDLAFPSLADIGCVWAPEMIYDEEAGKMMIYFTMRYGAGQTKLYWAYMNDDFTAFETEPELLFDYPDPKIQYLDGDITRVGDKYHLFYVAQERPGGIKQAVSGSINGGWEYDPVQYDFESGACEAPNVWKRIGEDRWVLMYDVFSVTPHNFGFAETTDFKNFTDLGRFNEGVMKTTNFVTPKHGSVMHLTKREAERLAAHWGVDIKF